MSVIFNALKKAEDSGSGDNDDKKNLNQSSIIEKAAKKTIKSRRKFNINKKIVIFGILILGLAFLFFNTAKKTIQEAIFNPKSNKQTSKRYVSSQEPAKKYSGGKLMLEGIIFDDSLPVAIINGEVIKAGEKIDEFEVLRITENNVFLIDGKSNEEIELTFK